MIIGKPNKKFNITIAVKDKDQLTKFECLEGTIYSEGNPENDKRKNNKKQENC